MIYEVVPTRALHIKPMAMKLRAAHRASIGAHGLDHRRALHDAVVQSHFCRTALVDGEPEAMWGMKGALLSDHALVWLAMSDRATKFPRLVVAEARRQLGEMGAHYSELATTVLPEDRASISFAMLLGFHDRHDAMDAAKTRKQRIAELIEDPRHHIPAGDSYVIAIGWHGNA